MASRYDEGPEVAPQNYPEVAQQPPPSSSPHYGYQQPYQAPKPEAYHDSSTYAGTASSTSPYTAAPFPSSQHATVDPSTRKKSKGVICGCSLLVFILSCIIALLSAAVIGLAAGTGVEANRANDATNKLAALSASVSSAAATKTSTSASPTATSSFNDIDKGCTNDPDNVSGTRYTSFFLLGNANFTVYCNRDAPGNSYMSLFTSDMDSCIDACSSYSMYTPRFFPGSKNTTCAGVSFIPLWTDKEMAKNGTAPGNCYLKPAPQNFAGLTVPQIGTECHAAILTG